jgi:plasmid stability protein
MNNSQLKKTTMQLPDDVIAWLKRRATHNVSSMTSEAIRALRNQMHEDRRAEQKEGATR